LGWAPGRERGPARESSCLLRRLPGCGRSDAHGRGSYPAAFFCSLRRGCIFEAVSEGGAVRCRVGGNPQRNALAALMIGGLHPPYENPPPRLSEQTLTRGAIIGYPDFLRIAGDIVGPPRAGHGGQETCPRRCKGSFLLFLRRCRRPLSIAEPSTLWMHPLSLVCHRLGAVLVRGSRHSQVRSGTGPTG